MIKHKEYNYKNRINEYINNLIIPYGILTAFLLFLGLIIELIFGYGVGETVGETTAFARVSISVGRLLEKAHLPLISTCVALGLSDESAVAGGIIGGFMAAFGHSFTFPTGSVTGSSGILGAIISGIVAGGVIKLIKYFFPERKSLSYIYTFISLVSTVIIMLTIGSISEIISKLTSLLFGALSNNIPPLCFLMLGIFTSLNPGGAMYIASMSFSSAMITNGDTTPNSALFAGSLSPVVALFIMVLLYRKQFSISQKLNYHSGPLWAFAGITITTIPYYIKHPFKAILSFSLGSGISGVLAYYFKCKTGLLQGGILGISQVENPLLLITATLCGGIISSILLILTTKFPKEKASAVR